MDCVCYNFLCFLVSIFYYFFFYRFYQSTDIAYVQADITWIMPKVSGEVREVKIKDNQFVKSGDILAVLDNRDYQARYDQAKSLVQLKEAALDVLSQNEKSAQSSIEEAYSGFQAAQADFNRLKMILIDTFLCSMMESLPDKILKAFSHSIFPQMLRLVNQKQLSIQPNPS